MAYIDTETFEYPFDEWKIRQRNPLTSFGSTFVAPERFAWVFPTQPDFDPVTQVATERNPVKDKSGQWQQAWTIKRLDKETSDVFRAQQLTQCKRQAVSEAKLKYAESIAAPVTFSASPGSEATFQADEKSLDAILKAIASFAGSTPDGFYWVAEDNSQVLFTAQALADLAKAIAMRNFAAFSEYQGLRGRVEAAEDEKAVNALFGR